MKKVLKISAWSLFLIGTLVLLAFVDVNYDNIKSETPIINIDKSTGHQFITEEAVIEKMNDMGYAFNNQVSGEIEVDRIEKTLLEMPGIKSVEVFKYNSGTIQIDIDQRRPIARVITKDGLISFYIDEQGNRMPISYDYVARVPIFNGNIKDNWNINSVSELYENDSLKAISVLDDIYEVALLFDENEFMQSQIVQVYINKDKEMEMIPRVGNHRILFGNAENAEIKFKKLTRFYTEVIDPKELNLYDTINTKYINQIICSKR